MSLDKETLRSQFGKDYKKFYETKLFKKEGFERRKCPKCGKWFWGTGNNESCGDSSHEPYSFIKDKPKTVSYVEFWKMFSDFFKKERHAIVDRYPVVSRWRQDLYFTIAGIQDFQRIENGRMSFEYPANPLLVPQICMRFNDIPNVGITGRHLTSFMMANQTAFNYPKEGYWRDRTIELNFNFLTKVLGVKKENLTYTEDVWAMGDFSEFGPCLESFANGLEMVNSVFTQFEYSNGKTKELTGKVVDVGWGFERLLWFYNGSGTAYDSAFRDELEYLSKGIDWDAALYRKVAGISGYIDMDEQRDSEKYEDGLIKRARISKNDYNNTIKPMQAAYAIADHSRTLLFAINDGALPSNMGGGYNLRVILRRIFDLVGEHGFGIDIMKLIEMQARALKPLYGGMEGSMEEIKDVFDTEKKRYNSTKGMADSIIRIMLDGREKITNERLRLLYESNGITPEQIQKAAHGRGIEVDMPENFYSGVVKSNFADERKRKEKVPISVEKLPKTEKLFYSFATEALAKALKVEGNFVVLDKTPFYAESGGQQADSGTINKIEIRDVQSVDGVIVHELESKPDFKIGKEVKCIVDIERRERLMAHHTATHLVSAAARAVLGKHAWQEGAKKTYEKAHIDVAHYERLSDGQVGAIESMANSYIFNGMKVKMSEMGRNAAEKEFGFSIYQGHGVPASRLRIVEIRDLKGKLIDAEACGGLHLMDRESMVGIIKIIGSYRIHDGVNRLEFVAGPAALALLKKEDLQLKEVAKAIGSDVDKLQNNISRHVQELEATKRDYSALLEKLSSSIADGIISRKKGAHSILMLPYPREFLRKIATLAVERERGIVVMLYNDKNDVVCIAGNDSKISASEFAKANIKRINGKASFVGGGSKRIAEGKVTEK